MPILKTIEGDIISFSNDPKNKISALVHGCNCWCIMGGGLAKQLAKKYPIVSKTDQNTVCGDYTKLGTYSSVTVGTIHKFNVLNAYIQYETATKSQNSPVEYLALVEVFKRINHEYKGKNVAVPLIGCGLANGTWLIVEHIIDNLTPDVNITVVKYKQ